MWFEGTPAQAISESRRTLKPLVVLLTGASRGSLEASASRGARCSNSARSLPSLQALTTPAARCRMPSSNRMARSTWRAQLLWSWRCIAAAAARGPPLGSRLLQASPCAFHCRPPQDDLANTDRSQFTDAKNFRAFCPVEALPTVRKRAAPDVNACPGWPAAGFGSAVGMWDDTRPLCRAAAGLCRW